MFKYNLMDIKNRILQLETSKDIEEHKEYTSSLIEGMIQEPFPNWYSVTSIGDHAFSYCDGLTSITIPDSVTSIGVSAFGDCYNLKSVTIHDSVTSIDTYAFQFCIRLENVIIGKGVTSISFGAFRNCYNLTNMIIPDSITVIEVSAFRDCTNLTDMYLHPTTPPTLESTDAISTATTTIHVPVGSGDAYKSATNWSAYADIIVEDIVIE